MHEAWGYLDLHRFFPGIRLAPDAAFERLWARSPRGARSPASDAPCRASPAQALLLILNVARAGGANAHDLERRRGRTRPTSVGARSRRSSVDLDAPVAFAAATGGLERYRGERDYRLWKVDHRGRHAVGRVVGARARRRRRSATRPRIVARAPLVNVEHLAHRLGRAPTRRDIVAEFFARPRRRGRRGVARRCDARGAR